MKIYEYRGSTYQFADDQVPTGAVLVKDRAPATKKVVQSDSKSVATKQRVPRNKGA